MNKKTIIIILIVAFVSVGVVIGYFSFYPKESTRIQTSWDNQHIDNQESSPEEEECGELFNEIIDGVIFEIQNSFIFVQAKDQPERVEKIKLTDKTEYREIILSEQMEVVNQKKIELGDLGKGDQVSVIVLCDKTKPEMKRALVVRRMVVRE